MSGRYSMREWLESGRYLPSCLRDFHDAKDVFKTIDAMVEQGENYRVNWVNAQVFTIDVFLWWMAQRGYTLQRTRTRLPFGSIANDVKARRDREASVLRSALKADATPEAHHAD